MGRRGVVWGCVHLSRLNKNGYWLSDELKQVTSSFLLYSIDNAITTVPIFSSLLASTWYPQAIPLHFHPPHVNVGPPVPLLSPLHTTQHLSASLPFLTVWMNVASLNLWFLDFLTAQFSDGFQCYLCWCLVVILSVVVQGDEACLPASLSWPEVMQVTNSKLKKKSIPSIQ